MSKKHDPDSNTDRESRSNDQIAPYRENSASIHRHPKMMCGLQEQLTRITGQLVSDHTKGLSAVEEVLVVLQHRGQEPFPDFAKNMIAEFIGIREELGTLDASVPGNAKRFVALAKRIDFLSRTLSFVVGSWLPAAGPDISAAVPSDSNIDP